MRLNPQQEAARTYVDGPLLVLAGAGSGKTGVITHKIAHLIRERGYLPEKVAAITFTNKAAREMKTRVARMLRGTDTQGLNVCTFHALGLRILMQECTRIGWRPGFSIFDTRDSHDLIRELLPRGTEPDTITRSAWQISRLKSANLGPEQALEEADSPGESALAELYAAYQEKLRHFNAFDFDDLIAQPVRLLSTEETARLGWQQRLRYLLVDEYQDTNASQFQLLQLLLGDRGALTAVGDDDQSIYGWRGAQPENLDLLKDCYADLEVIKLEQNYRSSRIILRAANHLIAHNPHSFEKRLWSDLGDGDPIRITPCDDATQEAERVVGAIIEQRFTLRCEHGDFAILFRSNHQAKLFEQTLRAHRIPYVLSGGQSFFERAEIRDLLSYLRLVANPGDDGAFLRVVNTPRREIGVTSVEAIADFGARHQVSMLEAIGRDACLARLGHRPAIQARRFGEWMSRLRADSRAPLPLVHRIIDETHFLDHLRRQSRDRTQADRRIRAVDDLIDWIKRLVDDAPEPLDLTELLRQLALANGDDGEDDSEGAVRLMTLHASKGLEFPHVYLVGVEEDILPHRNSVEEGTVEEERRLMYVGVTRAQRTLHLSYARSRRRFGEVIRCRPSRFLEELPADLVNWRGKDPERDAEQSRQSARAHLANLKALLDD